MIRKLKTVTGSWPKPAERRLYRLDPQPDLDNANVGMYAELIERCPCASLFSYRDFPFCLFCFLFTVKRKAAGWGHHFLPLKSDRGSPFPYPINAISRAAHGKAVRCPLPGKHGRRLPGLSRQIRLQTSCRPDDHHKNGGTTDGKLHNTNGCGPQGHRN